MNFKNCYCQGRGGGVQFSYVVILVGYSFDTPHFSEPQLGRNKRTVQPPPQALRFSHGRGERETSDW